MRIKIALCFLAICTAGCAFTHSGIGQTESGRTISGQVNIEAKSATTADWRVALVPANQSLCSGSFVRSNGELINRFSLSCQDGRTGRGVMTSNFSTLTDTLTYRLSGGESGSISFGGVAVPSGLNQNAYTVGQALGGGTTAPPATSVVRCREWGSNLECRAY